MVPDEPPLEVPDDPPPVVPPIEEPLPEVPLPDAPLPEVPLPDAPLPEVPDEPLASDDFFLLLSLSLSLLDADEPPELPDEPVMPELLDAPARSDEPEPPVDELWSKAAPALPSAETRTAINSLFMY
ncbi:MAG: hypothetical protein JWN57_3062 [Frankiales bacterium]|nr:hypothetical protein [Frankiales bacterium]